ncbi:hypothetical protein [Salinibacterium sp. TMP30]|uniref:hypothetical protein n=1 Tax=Salinibacterium sp. TMP30 TaxID=3138237 RepID=UPI003139C99F
MNRRIATLSNNLRGWPVRRWLVAAGTALLTYLVVAVPTDLIDTPVFSREVPPTWWAQPALIITAVLAGLLTATYVSRPENGQSRQSTVRLGGAGAIVSFFAVGCPVCNKLVLIALGTSGALQFFEPIQPYLAAASIALLVWALTRRLTSEEACPVTSVNVTEGADLALPR